MLVFVLAVGIGTFRAMAAKMEQFTCARGYDNSFSGLAIGLYLLVGYSGTLITGMIVNKTGKLEEVINVCGGLTCISCLIFTQFMRKPHVGGWILTSISV